MLLEPVAALLEEKPPEPNGISQYYWKIYEAMITASNAGVYGGTSSDEESSGENAKTRVRVRMYCKYCCIYLLLHKLIFRLTSMNVQYYRAYHQVQRKHKVFHIRASQIMKKRAQFVKSNDRHLFYLCVTKKIYKHEIEHATCRPYTSIICVVTQYASLTFLFDAPLKGTPSMRISSCTRKADELESSEVRISNSSSEWHDACISKDPSLSNMHMHFICLDFSYLGMLVCTQLSNRLAACARHDGMVLDASSLGLDRVPAEVTAPPASSYFECRSPHQFIIP
jgi:hypothetical protein